MSIFFKSKKDKSSKNNKLDSWRLPDKTITVSIKDKYVAPYTEGDKYYRDSDFENTPGYCLAKAMLFLQDKQTGVALQYLNQAISMDQKLGKAYKERGKIYKSQANYALAREDFNTALSIDPDDFSAYILRGVTFEEEGHLDSAISDFTSAILLKPEERVGYLHRGHSYFLSRRYQEAIQDYNRVLLINPKDAIAFRNRGLTHRHQGNLDSALQDLNNSIELEPCNATAYLNRSVVLYMRGRVKGRTEITNLFPHEAAAADFRKSLQLDPNTLTKALQTTCKLIKLYPDDFYHYLIRGVLHHLNGNHVQATEDHTKAFALNPTVTQTHSALTCCLNKHLEESDTKADSSWFYNAIYGNEQRLTKSESTKHIDMDIRRKSRFSLPLSVLVETLGVGDRKSVV